RHDVRSTATRPSQDLPPRDLRGSVPARVNGRPPGPPAGCANWWVAWQTDPLLKPRPVAEVRPREHGVEEQPTRGVVLGEVGVRSPPDELVPVRQGLDAAHVIAGEIPAAAVLAGQRRGACALVELQHHSARIPSRRDVSAAAGDLAAVVVEEGDKG